jgi:hypothetical protein
VSLPAIREALADVLRDAGWERQFTIHAYYPGSLSGNCVVIEPQGEYTNWYLTFGAGRRSQVNLQLRFMLPVSGADLVTAQKALDEVLSQGTAELSSLADLFQTPGSANRTLGGLVDDVLVASVSEYGFTDVAGNDGVVLSYIGCVVPVTIYATRS